ncbi:50S ribosomal protein L6 [Candidatus Marithrix sp. Canyon 246]|uniref:50S ribosomal protein L6 n=1 Tax=Candidatus Marithrix sp. Canyon 246 TaxID=1827136 RepID=UPI00084A0564|nr:50S ribosomal protein L6 [Candidatus Marithrix sp. Canyon 246]
MSRIANSPVEIPNGLEVKLDEQVIIVKGKKGSLEQQLPKEVEIKQVDNVLTFAARNNVKTAKALAGTIRALVNNMVLGVTAGFEKKLKLVGVGYRAQIQGKVLNLNLGFSHPINFNIPEGITIEAPSQTELVVKGISKQQVGQIAANIRAFRPPEPYKGKGVKYADEVIVRKEAKKK